MSLSQQPRRRHQRLTAAQLELLARIARGIPPLSKDDSALAVSVYALRARGLVVTPSVRTYWRATVTERGRQVLSPEPEVRDQLIAQPRGAGHHRRQSALAMSPQAAVEAVIAAGGVLRVPDPPPELRRAWRRTIHAINAGAVESSEHRLRYVGRDRGDLVVRLGDASQRTRRLPPVAVRIPTRLTGLHPLLLGLQDKAKGQPTKWVDTRGCPGMAHVLVTRKVFIRCLRLLHALVLEARRRGYGVDVVGTSRCGGGLGIIIDGRAFEIVVVEAKRRVPATGPAWGPLAHRPMWDLAPSGRLRLQEGHYHALSALAADGTRFRLEDRLGHALAKLEARAEELAARDLAVAQARATAQRAHEAALVVARGRYEAQMRATHLGEQAKRWRLATDIKAMVSAAAASGSPGVEAEWMSWALAYADEIDPLRHGLCPPPPPAAVTAEQLAPFMEEGPAE